MSEKKKRMLVTSVIVTSALLILLLGILFLITESFVVDAILHIFLRLLFVPIVIKVLQKSFKDMIKDSMRKMLALCGCAIVLDVVILDAIRYIVSHGTSTVLFLPVCLPICFMIILFYSSKDTGRDKLAEKRLMYMVGIPLLLLSLYFEALSFVEI